MIPAVMLEILETFASKLPDQILTAKFLRLTFAFADLRLLIPDLFAIADAIPLVYLYLPKFHPP